MDLYSAFIVVPHTQGARTDHTVLPANYTVGLPASTSQAFIRWRIPRLRLQPTTHLSTPKGWKAESAWLAGLQRTVYPHIVTCHRQVERRTAKVHLSETDVLPLWHATNMTRPMVGSNLPGDISSRGLLSCIVCYHATSLENGRKERGYNIRGFCAGVLCTVC